MELNTMKNNLDELRVMKLRLKTLIENLTILLIRLSKILKTMKEFP